MNQNNRGTSSKPSVDAVLLLTSSTLFGVVGSHDLALTLLSSRFMGSEATVVVEGREAVGILKGPPSW